MMASLDRCPAANAGRLGASAQAPRATSTDAQAPRVTPAGTHTPRVNSTDTQAPRATLSSALAAEVRKSRHAAPMRLALIMALPFPLIALLTAPSGNVSFSPWNYWYVLLMPVAIALFTGCVANADARMRNRPLLGSGAPLGQTWWAKALWCLMLSGLSNLVVLALYIAALAIGGSLSAAAVLTMALAALATTITSAWMIPAGLFLTARAGLLAGIFLPLAVQLVGGFAWSAIPVPQLFPPSATTVIPTAFIPVLPSGEPLAADTVLGGALAANGTLTWAGIAVAALTFVLLTAVSAAWFAQSEEVR
ncbi:hypothetical protein [Enorma massiliensis]|uniref:hypothetical protein n=1 Tax=Enorma massiliensis TaxID=1472761 RepID=UPI001EF569BE|nr:hypothetical protein [Enorma massiliensis]